MLDRRADDGTSGMRALVMELKHLTDLALLAERFRAQYDMFELGASWEDVHLSMSFKQPPMSH
jgi:hypothetical protein